MADHQTENGVRGNQSYINFPNYVQYNQRDFQNIYSNNNNLSSLNKTMMLQSNSINYNVSNVNKNIIKQPGPPSLTSYPKQRYTPYQSRYYQSISQGQQVIKQNLNYSLGQTNIDLFKTNTSELNASFLYSTNRSNFSEENQTVVLQIGNLDSSLEENTLRHNLLQQLKPITPVISLTFEGINAVKVKVPSKQFAKMVVAHLHRRKLGHKRMVVSYSRESSISELATLRCQVAGLLKDVPFYTLPMNKFRELFQSRFKSSISVIDLYRMQDICNINCNQDQEKVISLHQNVINSICSNNPLNECLQLSVPYCTIHFKKEQHKGWAEQDIEPLPNVMMTIAQLESVLHSLLKMHKGDIPILSIMHCIEAEINFKILSNENGVNLEHLISCVSGVSISSNQFGIKVLTSSSISDNANNYIKEIFEDPLYQISHEVVELIKLTPKSTLKFNKFIPAYHNHYGKQCRVADYGYTRLIDLFDALSSVVQVIGDGENRLLTLTHRTQQRRFTNELMRILKMQTNKSLLLSQLPNVFSQTQNHQFDITDYGICELVDILDGLVHNNTVVTTVYNETDFLISIPKRQQTNIEMEKTCVFAGEVVELLKNTPQYSILFQKFVRSYHYHFGFQCRLCDYGYFKLADLMEAINGIVEIDATSDEHRKIFLAPKVAQRVFSEQLHELTCLYSKNNRSKIKLCDLLNLHKNKFGYQIQPQNLGFTHLIDAIQSLPFIEIIQSENDFWIICHHDDILFRRNCFAVCTTILRHGREDMPLTDFCNYYNEKFSESSICRSIIAMNNFVEIKQCKENNEEIIELSPMMKFIIRIIELLEIEKKVSISHLKCSLNISISTCFQFGYPNITSLIKAFPDIFIFKEAGPGQSSCEVQLDNQRNFLQISSQNVMPNFANKSFTENATTSLHLNQDKNDLNENNNCNNFCFNKFMIGKQDFYSNESKLYNENSMNSIYQKSKIYERRDSGIIPNIQKALSFPAGSIYDPLAYAKIMSSLYEPPKPDTPPSKIVPFWIDPIWANATNQWSPKIDSLNIHLPELKTVILPVVLSPCAIIKSDSLFQFE